MKIPDLLLALHQAPEILGAYNGGHIIRQSQNAHVLCFFSCYGCLLGTRTLSKNCDNALLISGNIKALVVPWQFVSNWHFAGRKDKEDPLIGSSRTLRTFCTSLSKHRAGRRDRQEKRARRGEGRTERDEGGNVMFDLPKNNRSIHFPGLPAHLLVPSLLTWRMMTVGLPSSFSNAPLVSAGKTNRSRSERERLARGFWIISAQTSVLFISCFFFFFFWKPTHERITRGQDRKKLKLCFFFPFLFTKQSNKPRLEYNNGVIRRPRLTPDLLSDTIYI